MIWIAHVGDLNVTWERILKGGEIIPWPEPPFSVGTPGAPANTFDQLDGVEQHMAVWAQHRLDTALVHLGLGSSCTSCWVAFSKVSGVLPSKGIVGSICSTKSIFAAHIERKLKESMTGHKHDFLAGGCVIPGTQTVTHKNRAIEDDKCTWRLVHIKNHVHQCQKLQAEWHDPWASVDTERGGSSLSETLETASESAGSTVLQENTSSSTKIAEYFTPTKISPEWQAQIDLLLFKLIICCTIPFSLLGNTFFLEFILTLAPNYTVPEHTSFFARNIEAEIAAVRKRLKDFLGRKTHMTLSLEGWSSHAKDKIYTFHTTIPSWCSFFTDSHILETFDPWKYSAITGDGGPNGCSVKHMIDLGFTSALSNYFGKSNISTYHLTEERAKMIIGTKPLCKVLGKTSVHYVFMSGLAMIIQLMSSIANGILTLEVSDDDTSRGAAASQYRWKEEVLQLQDELIRYVYNQAPFDSQYWTHQRSLLIIGKGCQTT
ncbi:hypothetical protein B0H10DRAFT_1950757 [Mycena sp. CBHHK59/15]|nr:hypothetical protein B0H10DRAFT_1950757 [Mycena sp. CBHHK59/15]